MGQGEFKKEYSITLSIAVPFVINIIKIGTIKVDDVTDKKNSLVFSPA